jgi:uncharacterized integral membrane protein
LTQSPQSAGNVFRKIVAAVILVPIAIVIIAFAVANRQIVTVSLDPFSSESPAASVTLPLFALIIALLIIGVLVGGAAAWLRQSRWRRTARRLEREVSELRGEVALLKRSTAGAPYIPEPAEPPERLQLKPPAY